MLQREARCSDKMPAYGWLRGTITSTPLNWFGSSLPTFCLRHLHPFNKFIIKYPSPQEPTMFLLLLAKSYPKFKIPLNAAIARLKATKPAGYTKKLAMLEDLQMLVEFAIPTVRAPTFTFSEDTTHEQKINKK